MLVASAPLKQSGRSLSVNNDPGEGASMSLSDWTQKVTARASLTSAELCATAVLSLFQGKSSDGFALVLLDALQGDPLWFKVLNAQSRFDNDDQSLRRYVLSNGEQDGPATITFADEVGAYRMSTNISRACRRLEKRASGLSRTFTTTRSDDIITPEGLAFTSAIEDAGGPSRPNATFSAPSTLVRRLTLQPTSKRIPTGKRRYSAPPVMEEPTRVDADLPREKVSIEKVEKWLESMQLSERGHASPRPLSSAPPCVTVHSPVDDDVWTPAAEERPAAVSLPVARNSFSNPDLLQVPGSIPVYEVSPGNQPYVPPLERCPKIWTAIIETVKYEIPDVTDDIAGVHDGPCADRGGFGYIRRGTLHGNNVAIKQLKQSGSNAFSKKIKMAETKRFRREVVMAMLCASMKHQNIIEFKGIVISEELGACLVFPWMKNGNSLDYVNDKNNEQVPRLAIIHGTLEGLAHLHSRNFKHGDIKAQNVLISDDGNALITDFGLGTCADFDGEQQSISIQRAGNAQWMAPELFEDGVRKWTKMSDMWAFGMFTIEIFTGAYPFPNGTRPSIETAIYKRNLPPRPDQDECSDELWSMIQRCWAMSSKARVTAEEALEIMGSLSRRHKPFLTE